MIEISKWFQERPKWLQKAAYLLLTRGSFADEDITAFVEKCLQETDGEGTEAGFTFPPDAFQTQSAAPLRLCSIGNVSGINALAPRIPLDFGSNNLVVVYGGNGTGKSGYVRILKHACGARHPGVLHPNVYLDGSVFQKAEIKYRLGDQECQTSWNASDAIQADLRPVDIYDTDCGRMYLESESEVTYEPPALLFFSDLIAVCEQVARLIDVKLSNHKSNKPQIPREFADSKSGKWYTALNSQTSLDDIVTHTTWDGEDNKVVADLDKRLAEKAPADKARELLVKKQYIEDLIRLIEGFLTKLSDENCHRVLKLKEERLIKREAAKAAATKVFSGSSLDGIGSDAWKHLWEHARKYSEEYAYPGQTFPNISPDARCVLCHQTLSNEARQRLTSFEEFVKGQAEKEAKNAEKVFDEAITDIGDIPTAQSIKVKCDAGGLNYEGELPPIVQSVEMFRQRREKLLEVDVFNELPKNPDCEVLLRDVQTQASVYSGEAEKCQEDAKSDTRPQLQAQLQELKARKWLSEQYDAIKTEIESLRAIKRLERAKRLTDTRGLSRKKGEIAEELITEAFVNRFRNELSALGAARIKVELTKKRVNRGRVLHELRLAEACSGALCEVLSEGEHRVVSLAAFLADVTGKQHPAPFVFDDPISSLDQDFEEAVVQRLVRLSVDRQVIVFTHRISLLVMLQEYGKREGREPTVTCLRSESWGTGQPSDTPLFAKKPDKALNALLNENLAKARKIYNEEGQKAYEPYAKAICSEFRILLERMIECELLADVVQRFRRALNTQGKLNKLAHITVEDCKFFDEMMTNYSRYEHSQPTEAPVTLPTPNELKNDLESLRDWRNEFKKRAS